MQNWKWCCLHSRRELTAAEKKHADLVAQDKGNRVLANAPSSQTDAIGNGVAEVELNDAAMQRQELMGAEKRLKDGTNHALRIGEGLEGVLRLCRDVGRCVGVVS